MTMADEGRLVGVWTAAEEALAAAWRARASKTSRVPLRSSENCKGVRRGAYVWVVWSQDGRIVMCRGLFCERRPVSNYRQMHLYA